MTFYNVSNHPSNKWSKEQRDAALKYADEIIDITFPTIDPHASTDEVYGVAYRFYGEHFYNKRYEKHTIMIMGEMLFTYAFVHLIYASQLELSSKNNLTLVHATTERIASTIIKSDGTTEKQTVFNFVQFRKYY